MAEAKPLRIAIIGAGIGGLTLSTALGILGRNSTGNLKVDVYEAADVISEIGAGINFWPRTWNIMNELGLNEQLVKFLQDEDIPDDRTEHLVFKVRKSDQLKGRDIRDITITGGSVRLHRVHLQQTLLNGMTGQLHLSHRLVSYEEINDEVRLDFANGTTLTCDLLVGMDGLKSQVRRVFLESRELLKPEDRDPIIWSGAYAYRGLVDVDTLAGMFPGHHCLSMPMLYAGKNKHLIVYRVAQAKLVNVVAVVTDPAKENTFYDGPAHVVCEQEEMLRAYEKWEPEVQALLQCIKKPMKFALRSLKPLTSYVSGRVILAGDAAHAMLPHQGAGAGQAIEDAYILANLLSQKPLITSQLPKIAEIYDRIRCPEGNRVLEASRISGLVSQLVAPGFEEVGEGDEGVSDEMLQDLIEELSRQWSWTWKESAEDDRRRAMAFLESEIC
ncbi:salicylate hydroxylase [Pholiota conissans]|uniref:Salicylate hydroxylase n=1 Tax=Pholiota conissans TaxID=109636 RepID=A0A9P5YNS9_9AGAR|nr:salicylate hydroxylase [Pholiota conissans]